jgi:hypothetical protein
MNSIVGGKIADRAYTEALEENVCQCHSSHHKSHIAGIEPGLLRVKSQRPTLYAVAKPY